MQALPQTPRSTTEEHRRMLLADTLRETTRVQVWEGGDHGSLVAAFPWLEEAVRLIRAMGKHDANGIVITEGTRVLWTEGVDGALRHCASDGDAVDTVQELNGPNPIEESNNASCPECEGPLFEHTGDQGLGWGCEICGWERDDDPIIGTGSREIHPKGGFSRLVDGTWRA